MSEVLDGEHTEHGAGWRAHGRIYGDGRLHVQIINAGRWPRHPNGYTMLTDARFNTRGDVPAQQRIYDRHEGGDGPLTRLMQKLQEAHHEAAQQRQTHI
ncbi:hypothetical protein PQR53_08470 [Paraburkholderia fungorum]|uniref:hypothetical protein n=1 Tax=Paraburkholderia fungorum TaxID=134537 RepID=UPI0038BC7FD2